MLIGTALSAALSACAGASDDYPSLAIREVERVRGGFDVPPCGECVEDAQCVAPSPAPSSMSPPTPAPPPELPASYAQRTAALLADVRAADTAFQSSLATARSRVAAARGAALGTPAWGSAQVALADLTSKRSATAIPVTDLEKLAVEIELEQLPNIQMRDAYQEAVRIIQAQDDALEGLYAQVSR